MSVYIGSLQGSRGRCIDLYDNKCIITTDVTLGSLLTHNALDGQKTLFYVDITGVQFKESKLTLGYLQLETPSMQMNNQSNNMFSENTFTFEDNVSASNRVMRLVHQFLVDRLEGYKYHFEPSKDSLMEMVLVMNAEGHKVSPVIFHEATSLQQDLFQKREQAKQEKLQQQQEEKTLAIRTMREKLKEDENVDAMLRFLERAASCSKVSEVKELWEAFALTGLISAEIITEKIDAFAKIEKLYGSGPNDLNHLLSEICQIASIKTDVFNSSATKVSADTPPSTIRCPSCGASQFAGRSTCWRCRAKLK